MTLIEVQIPQEKAQTIPVNHEPVEYGVESARYRQEAEALESGTMEHWAKLDTANYLSKRALEVKTQEYLGNNPSKQLGKSAVHNS